jgi:vacuolar protein sorting-associated protein 13A/C
VVEGVSRAHLWISSYLRQPISFEPVAADMQIVMSSGSGETDHLVGLSYAEGLGKVSLLMRGLRYQLTSTSTN